MRIGVMVMPMVMVMVMVMSVPVVMRMPVIMCMTGIKPAGTCAEMVTQVTILDIAAGG